MSLGPGQLLRLTALKAVGNTALRWIPFFLFVLEDAFDTTTTTLTLIIGLGDMLGLSSLLIGGHLDQGRERVFLISAMIMISGSGLIAMGGTVWSFAIAFALVVVATSFITVGGHAWLSRRVPFERRGRVIGIFEMSWASALLIGAPIVALTIEVVGWRGPFLLLSIASAGMAVVISQLADEPVVGDVVVGAGAPTTTRSLQASTWVAIAMSAAIATAGLTTIVIVGTWLEDVFDVSTGQIGLTAMAFGLAEITASGTSARFSDQLGKHRTTAAALVILGVGLIVMFVAATSFVLAIIGLALFFLGFEYAIVTSFSIVSEATPLARGRALAANNALGTLVRGGGAVASGFLFTRYGIAGPATLSIIATVLGLVLLAQTSRSAPD